MKINIISCFILLSFVSISVAVEPRLEANLVRKFVREIETDKSDDDRPQEIQDLDKTFEDGLDTFIKERSQDFQDVVSGLVKDISKLREAYTNQGKPLFFRKMKECLFSSTGEAKEINCFGHLQLFAKAFAPDFEKFKEYFESIIGLNSELLDQLKEVSKKIGTVSFVKPLEPEEIGMLSVGSSSTFDHNNMEDIKKLLIDVISQAMTCRFKVVYMINWIRVLLGNFKNKIEWMKLRHDLVELNQKYNAIEINLSEFLTSFNDMVSNPDKRDDSKIKKFINYFEETIGEEKFILKTKEIIEKIDMKRSSLETLDLLKTFMSVYRESLLNYLDECKQEMKDKLEATGTVLTRNRIRRTEEIIKNLDNKLKEPIYKDPNSILVKMHFKVTKPKWRDEGEEFRRIIYEKDTTGQISYITRKLERLQMDNNLIERIKTDIASDKKQIKRIVWFLLKESIDDRYISDEDERKEIIIDIMGYDNHLYRLELQMNIIRSALSSSNDYDQMVAETSKAIETLMNRPIIKDGDLSEALETFKDKML